MQISRHKSNSSLLSPDEKFRAIKVKVSLVEPKKETIHLDNYDYLVGRNFDGRNFRWATLSVGRNFRHFSKNSSLSPDKVSPDKVPAGNHCGGICREA